MFRVVAVTSLLAAPIHAQAPKFVPVDVPVHEYNGGWEHFVGGGVAVFDCNDDDLPDLYAAGGANAAMLLRNISTPQGDVAFVDATPDLLALTSVIGAYPINLNNDAHMDLIILRVGPNIVRLGQGDCQFAATDAFDEMAGSGWTTAFSASWEQGQSLPTLAFGNYVDRDDPDGPFGACDSSYLYRPIEGGYGKALSLTPSFCPLSMLFSDWGRTGRRDLRVSNDRHYYVQGGQEQLWAMEPIPRLYGPSDGWADHQLWGMGIASRDITGDGLPEVMMTSMGDQRLQMRDMAQSGPAFLDAPYDLGTTAHRPYTGGDGRPSTGWHVEFGDVNNDGRDDIFIAKGNVEQMPGLAMKDPNNLLVQSSDATFVEGGTQAGLASLHRGRGAALADLNGDGLLEVVIVNRRAPMEVFQNTTSEAGNWVSFDLHQGGANQNAVGAWIEVDIGGRTMAREVSVGGGHAGGQIGPQHFGLGQVEKVRVRVIWPDQTVSDWRDVSAGHVFDVIRTGNSIDIRN